MSLVSSATNERESYIWSIKDMGGKRMREMRSNAYLLHFKHMQAPFHLLGRGPKPSSLKDLDFVQIPISNIPTITSLSNAGPHDLREA